MAPLTYEDRVKQLCIISIVTTLIWRLDATTTQKEHKFTELARRRWWWRRPLPRWIRGRGWERWYKLLRRRLVAVDERASLWMRREPFSARKNKLMALQLQLRMMHRIIAILVVFSRRHRVSAAAAAGVHVRVRNSLKRSQLWRRRCRRLLCGVTSSSIKH